MKQSVDDLSTTLNTEGQTIEDTVNSASGISGLLSAGAKISTSLSKMYAALADTFQTLDDADVKGEMKTAFDQADSCSGLRGSNG